MLTAFTVVAQMACFLSPLAAGAQRPVDPLTAMDWLKGHWMCTSVSGGKTTRYTTDWARVEGGRWIRGINRSGASASEDLVTYDRTSRQWRTVDLEPDGSMSVLLSVPGASALHVSTHSVYPNDSQTVALDKQSHGAYRLRFDFVLNGKHSLWEDDCTR